MGDFFFATDPTCPTARSDDGEGCSRIEPTETYPLCTLRGAHANVIIITVDVARGPKDFRSLKRSP